MSEQTCFTHYWLFQTVMGILNCSPIRTQYETFMDCIDGTLEGYQYYPGAEKPCPWTFAKAVVSYVRLAKTSGLGGAYCPVCKRWPRIIVGDGTGLRNMHFKGWCARLGIDDFVKPGTLVRGGGRAPYQYIQTGFLAVHS